MSPKKPTWSMAARLRMSVSSFDGQQTKFPPLVDLSLALSIFVKNGDDAADRAADRAERIPHIGSHTINLFRYAIEVVNEGAQHQLGKFTLHLTKPFDLFIGDQHLFADGRGILAPFLIALVNRPASATMHCRRLSGAGLPAI
ncbi:MAG: hypothetical protein U5M50_01000 [Sphingobium sp.]|nr:hypothetical protein [Sphingobium sp.]